MKTISKELIGTSIGTLLGDSWLEKYALSCEHSKQDSEYIHWKKDIFDQLSGRKCALYNRVGRTKTINNIETTSCDSIQLKLLYRDLVKLLVPLMYNADNKKTITNKALNLITPFGFIMWYFDDGSFNYSQISSSIYTNGFTIYEHKLLKKWLLDKYNINANIVNKSNSKCLYFKRKDTLKLLAFIESNCKNIPICMRRKIPIEWKNIHYNSNYKWNRISYKLSDYDAKKKIKENLLNYHKNVDNTNIDKNTYFNIIGYKNWNDSYSISKAIRRVFGSMNAALIYSNLPTNIC